MESQVHSLLAVDKGFGGVLGDAGIDVLLGEFCAFVRPVIGVEIGEFAPERVGGVEVNDFFGFFDVTAAPSGSVDAIGDTRIPEVVEVAGISA